MLAALEHDDVGVYYLYLVNWEHPQRQGKKNRRNEDQRKNHDNPDLTLNIKKESWILEKTVCYSVFSLKKKLTPKELSEKIEILSYFRMVLTQTRIDPMEWDA